jgi:hypothetical protein
MKKERVISALDALIEQAKNNPKLKAMTDKSKEHGEKMKKLKEGTYKAKGPRNNKPKGPKK